jgi:hypothetical protein
MRKRLVLFISQETWKYVEQSPVPGTCSRMPVRTSSFQLPSLGRLCLHICKMAAASPGVVSMFQAEGTWQRRGKGERERTT